MLGDANVMAAEADRDVGVSGLVVHLVVVPEDLGIVHDAHGCSSVRHVEGVGPRES